MNTKLVFLATASVTFAASIVGTHLLSKKIGKKEAVNNLRAEQLSQTFDELMERRALAKKGFSGNFADLQSTCEAIDIWYAEEQRVINEMYDDIINNL